jgi:hypothetical protein
MIYILFIAIVFLFIFSYYIFKRNLLNPSVVLCGTFLVSLFFSILNMKKWGIIFSEKTVLVILITIFSFIMGNMMLYLLPKKDIKFQIKNNINLKKIPFRIIILLDFFLLIGLKIYIKDVYNLSLLGGNTGGYQNMLFFARMAKLAYFDITRLSINIYFFAKCSSYVTLFSFFYIMIFKKIKLKDLYLLTPSFIYIVFMIFSTGRTDFIFMFVFILITYFSLLYRKHNFSRKITRKILFYTFISLGLFLLLFSFLGTILGRPEYNSIFELVSKYTGTSLPALNSFIEESKEYNSYFGKHTLISFYSILRKLGYEIPIFNTHYEFIYFDDGTRTNVYSAIRRYLEDFDYFGLYLLTFIFGMFYGIFFDKVVYNRKSYLLLIYYSSICYPIFMYPIDELFFRGTFPVVFINNFIFIGILYYILIYRPSKKQKRKRT